MSDRPLVDYTSKDYAGFRRMMLDAKREHMPEWTSDSPNDFGVVILEMFAYVGDILSFYGDRIATEAFLSTAVSRASVIDHALVLDYRPTGVSPATVDIEFTTSEEVTIPAGTKVTTRPTALTSLDEQGATVTFEVDEDTLVDGTGLVPATEGVTVEELVGFSTGRIDQSAELDQFPVIEGSIKILVDEGVGFTQWSFFERLVEANASRNAYTAREDGRGVVTIQFGDGVNGRVPPSDAEIRAEYRVGLGEVGNVGPGTLRDVQIEDATAASKVIDVVNPSAATGGNDAESSDSIRRNAPAALRSLYRAVTLEDYGSLALRIPGIAKARSVQESYNTVAIYVAPFGEGSAASTGKKEEVQEFMNARKMSNITVLVEDPEFVPINVHVDATILPEYNRSQVSTVLEEKLTAILEFDRVDFGQFIAISQVYNAIGDIEGVSFADVTVLDRGVGDGLGNVQLEDLEIPVVGTITVSATGGILGT